MSVPAPEALQAVGALVRELSGICVEPRKLELLAPRLGALAEELGRGDLFGLVHCVRSDPALAQRLLNLFTVHETYFFRDVGPFDALRTEILPRLIEARRETRSLRIWCAAASSGQEPYSLAMLLMESFPELASWSVELRATDLSEPTLERAREGVYSALEVGRGLSLERRQRFFEPCDAAFRLRADVRRLVRFEALNLLEPWALPRLDLILMRNVLIYFDEETKARLLRRATDQLAPDGALILGACETPIFHVPELRPRGTGAQVWFEKPSPDEAAA